MSTRAENDSSHLMPLLQLAFLYNQLIKQYLKVPDSSSFMPVKLLDLDQSKTGATHSSAKPKDFERVELANAFPILVNVKQQMYLSFRDLQKHRSGAKGELQCDNDRQ